MEAATRPATSVLSTRFRRQASFSSVNPSMSASIKDRNTSAAISGARQPNTDASHPYLFSTGVTGCSRTDFRSSAPSSPRRQDCSVVVSKSNSSPQRMPPSMSKSSSAGAPLRSGVADAGTGDGLGVAVGRGVDVGAGAAVGSGVADGTAVAVGVGVSVGRGSSPHAESRTAAIRHGNPISAARWMSPRNPVRTGKANRSRACLRRLLPDYALREEQRT